MNYCSNGIKVTYEPYEDRPPYLLLVGAQILQLLYLAWVRSCARVISARQLRYSTSKPALVAGLHFEAAIHAPA